MKPILFSMLSLCLAALPARAATSTWAFEGPETGYSGVNNSTTTVTTGTLSVANSSAITRINFEFTPITLANAGDYLEVAFQVQLGTGGWGAPSSSFRYMQTVVWNDIGANSPGYGGWLSTNTGNRNRIYEYGNAGNVPQPGGDVIVGGNDNSFNIGSGTVNFRQISLRIERAAADSVTITYTGAEDGGTPRSLSRTDSTGSGFTFNSFDIVGGGGTSLNFNLDNVSVSTNVPEPSAALFSAFACAGLLMRRRR